MCSQHRLPRRRTRNAGYAHGHARVHASLGKGGGKRGLISIRFSLSLVRAVVACAREPVSVDCSLLRHRIAYIAVFFEVGRAAVTSADSLT